MSGPGRCILFTQVLDERREWASRADGESGSRAENVCCQTLNRACLLGTTRSGELREPPPYGGSSCCMNLRNDRMGMPVRSSYWLAGVTDDNSGCAQRCHTCAKRQTTRCARRIQFCKPAQTDQLRGLFEIVLFHSAMEPPEASCQGCGGPPFKVTLNQQDSLKNTLNKRTLNQRNPLTPPKPTLSPHYVCIILY